MQKQKISRRNVVKALGVGTVGVATVGGAAFLSTGKARAQASLQIEDREVTTPDGMIEEIAFTSNGECSYSNVSPEVTHIQLVLTINGEVAYDEILPLDDSDLDNSGEGVPGPHNGQFVYWGRQHEHNRKVKFFESTSYGPTDFKVSDDGTSESFDLNVSFQFRLLHGDNAATAEEILRSNTAEATAKLTIHNGADSNDGEDGDNGSGGSGGNGGSDPDPEASMNDTQVRLRITLPDGEVVRS